MQNTRAIYLKQDDDSWMIVAHVARYDVELCRELVEAIAERVQTRGELAIIDAPNTTLCPDQFNRGVNLGEVCRTLGVNFIERRAIDGVVARDAAMLNKGRLFSGTARADELPASLSQASEKLARLAISAVDREGSVSGAALRDAAFAAQRVRMIDDLKRRGSIMVPESFNVEITGRDAYEPDRTEAVRVAQIILRKGEPYAVGVEERGGAVIRVESRLRDLPDATLEQLSRAVEHVNKIAEVKAEPSRVRVFVPSAPKSQEPGPKGVTR